jgi:hypothetical protein
VIKILKNQIFDIERDSAIPLLLCSLTPEKRLGWTRTRCASPRLRRYLHPGLASYIVLQESGLTEEGVWPDATGKEVSTNTTPGTEVFQVWGTILWLLVLCDRIGEMFDVRIPFIGMFDHSTYPQWHI